MKNILLLLATVFYFSFGNAETPQYSSANFNIAIDSANSFIFGNSATITFNTAWFNLPVETVGPIIVPFYQTDNMSPEWADDAWPVFGPGNDSTQTFTVTLNGINITDSINFKMHIAIMNYANVPMTTDTVFYYDQILTMYVDNGTVTSTQDQPNEKTFSVYPNPATNFITINDPESTTAFITNSLGQLVMEIPTNEPRVNISGLSSGIYYINRKHKLVVAQ